MKNGTSDIRRIADPIAHHDWASTPLCAMTIWPEDPQTSGQTFSYPPWYGEAAGVAEPIEVTKDANALGRDEAYRNAHAG